MLGACKAGQGTAKRALRERQCSAVQGAAESWEGRSTARRIGQRRARHSGAGREGLGTAGFPPCFYLSALPAVCATDSRMQLSPVNSEANLIMPQPNRTSVPRPSGSIMAPIRTAPHTINLAALEGCGSAGEGLGF